MITYYILDTKGTSFYSIYRQVGDVFQVCQSDVSRGEWVNLRRRNIHKQLSMIGKVAERPISILFQGSEKEYEKYLLGLELIK